MNPGEKYTDVENIPITHVPLGHYYSPIVNPDNIRDYFEETVARSKIFNIAGIDIQLKRQKKLFRNHFVPYWKNNPLPEEDDGIHKYFLNNNAFTHIDGMVLQAMIATFRPKKYIENRFRLFIRMRT